MSATESVSSQELHAFVDGELELARQVAIERRLVSEPALRMEVEELRALRAAIREGAEYHRAPTGLMSELSWPGVEPGAQAVPGWRRWFAWRPLLPAFALAALLIGGLNLWLLAPSPAAEMLHQVLASHVRATVGQKLVDVASSDQHTVKPWLSSRLDYSPPVADAPVPGAIFLGGRIDYLDDRPVAALVYRQRQHLIEVYVWPATGHDEAPRSLSQRGFHVLHWVRGGMRFWVISDINKNELGDFVAALQKTDAMR